MKILKIEFENLNSLRGVQTIDLESGDLAEAGIFAITGPTGAGKSTILDAITLALYGRAARYGSSPSPENMMSRHTGFCRSEIVFETPAGRFRSAWLLNRARKKPDGKIQQAKHQVFDQDETPLTQKIKETADKIEELIGLDFDRFLRSVLLAQGEFAKFLKSDVNERSRLLESLTGTSIYSDLSQLVYEQHKDRANQLKQREEQLDAVVLLTADELKEKQAQSKTLEDELKSLKAKLKDANKHIETGKQLRDANESTKKLNSAIKSLEGQGKALAADKKRLESHQKAVSFKPDLERIDQQRVQCSEADKQVRLAVEQTETSGQTLKRQLQHASDWLAVRTKQLQEKLTAESERQATLTEKKTLTSEWLKANAADETLAEAIPNLRTGFAELTSSQNKSREAAARLKKLAESTKKTEGTITQTRKDLDSLAATLKTEQGALSKQQELLAKELDGADSKALNEQRDRLTEKIAALNAMAGQEAEAKELKQAIDTKQTAAKQKQGDTRQQERELKKATKASKDQEETCAALEIAVEQARLFAELADHRANLKDREECPLCGSLKHPAADGKPASPLTTLQDQLGKARNSLKEMTAAQQTQAERLTLAKAKLQSELREIENDQQRLSKLKLNLDQQATKLKLSAEEAEDLTATGTAVETQLENCKQRMAQVDVLRAEVQKHEQAVQQSLNKQRLLTQSLESADGNLNELKSQHTEATAELEAANIDVQNQTNQLDKMLEPLQLTTPDPESIQTFQRSLDQRSQEFQTQTKTLAKLESDLNDSQQTQKNFHLAQQENAKAITRVETWTNEDALRSVVLPAAANTKLVTTWSDTDELLDQIGKLYGQWQQAVSREQERKTRAAESRKTFTNATSALLTKVVQGGFGSMEELVSTLLSDEGAERIARDLDQHKQQLSKMQGQLEQLETTLKSLHEKSAPDEQELTRLINELEQIETDAGHKQKELATIETALENDAKQRLAQEQAHKELQSERQQLLTWQRLNEIMGSADGKKFRTFAQGISLDLVVRHANQHLTELSKRYRLQRRAADSLGLEICDLHQANALRPMESLSGGESFVVSLALALGLSDLAGQSVRIDSLFIDEGFGTLDPETLDMAVAALERLQARNKTIGVISHVELLKERITTQIQVQPMAGGTSELKIVA